MMLTQFIRESVAIPLRWGWWHVACFAEAIDKELGTDDPLPGFYTFTQAHSFTDESDGEVLDILPGDTFTRERA